MYILYILCMFVIKYIKAMELIKLTESMVESISAERTPQIPELLIKAKRYVSSMWTEDPHLIVKTLQGDVRADIGDWITEGLNGGVYPRVLKKEPIRHCCELECDKTATIHIEFSDKTEDSSDFCDSCLIGNIPKGHASFVSPILN